MNKDWLNTEIKLIKQLSWSQLFGFKYFTVQVLTEIKQGFQYIFKILNLITELFGRKSSKE